MLMCQYQLLAVIQSGSARVRVAIGLLGCHLLSPLSPRLSQLPGSEYTLLLYQCASAAHTIVKLPTSPQICAHHGSVPSRRAGYPDPPNFGPPPSKKMRPPKTPPNFRKSVSRRKKIRLNSAQYRPIAEMYETGSASLVLICCFRPC